jgi:hypothetical protein
MNPFPSSRAAGLWTALAALLLAGCSSSQNMAHIGVSSPPPPLIGSTPIAAYDDFARATAPATKIRIEAVAQTDAP